MKLRFLSLSLFALTTVLIAGSCQKRNAQVGVAASGLTANKNYIGDRILYDRPERLFVNGGEITDRAVIGDFQLRHPWLTDSFISERPAPPNIVTTQTELVYYAGPVPYKASLGSDDVLLMRQQDSSEYEIDTEGKNARQVYRAARNFFTMRDQILETLGSRTTLELVDSQSCRVRENLRIQGTYKNGTIRLPYTLIASSSTQQWRFPFSIKPGVIPQVPPGDTLLLHEGYIELR